MSLETKNCNLFDLLVMFLTKHLIFFFVFQSDISVPGTIGELIK